MRSAIIAQFIKQIDSKRLAFHVRVSVIQGDIVEHDNQGCHKQDRRKHDCKAAERRQQQTLDDCAGSASAVCSVSSLDVNDRWKKAGV